MEDLCEMCQRLGHNCKDKVDKEEADDDDDAVSVVSTISTVIDANACDLTPAGSEDEQSPPSGSDTEDELADGLDNLRV